MDKYERMAAKLLKQSHDKEASKPADIILQQMGGARRLSAMIGAKKFSYMNGGKTLRFEFPMKRSKTVCEVSLTSLDLYDMEIYTLRMPRMKKIHVTEEMAAEEPALLGLVGMRIPVPSSKPRTPKKKVVVSHQGIYNDQLVELFEKATGLYLRF
jgi:hypothetical protein